MSNNREAAAWGGLVGKRVMACEMVPMMVKIQSLSNRMFAFSRPLTRRICN